MLLTNTVSCSLMMGFGDVLQQRNEHWKRYNKEDSSISQNGKLPKPGSRAKKEDENLLTITDTINDSDKEYVHDYLRTRNMLIIGFVQGPFQHYFYAALDRTLPGKDTITIVKKTMIDQLIASPTCLAIFFFGLGGLEHKRMKDINNEVKLKFMDTWKVKLSIKKSARYKISIRSAFGQMENKFF